MVLQELDHVRECRCIDVAFAVNAQIVDRVRQVDGMQWPESVVGL